MSEALNAKRRELEGKDRVRSVCTVHGAHDDLVCVACYDAQAARVEVQSSELRIANTTTALRRWVLDKLAERNGRNGTDH